nr:MAG TPA: hypothetical protein [Caudoviricetes sp.]
MICKENNILDGCKHLVVKLNFHSLVLIKLMNR